MGLPRLVPERTVDSLFAAEVVLHDPGALVWSPTNYHGSWDHSIVRSSGRVGVFECKALLSNAARDPAQPWTIPLRQDQLYVFAWETAIPVLYVLPAQPADPDEPWMRRCAEPGCPNHQNVCAACFVSRQDTHSRKWAGYLPHIQSAPAHLRFQPWFCHWAWVVPARSLAADVGLTYGNKPGPTDRNVSAADARLAVVRDAVRLCHWLSRVVGDGGGGPRGGRDLAIEDVLASVGSLDGLTTVTAALLADDDGETTPPVVCAFSPADADAGTRG